MAVTPSSATVSVSLVCSFPVVAFGENDVTFVSYNVLGSFSKHFLVILA